MAKPKSKFCQKHNKEVIPCIQENFQGCITPHPNPGVHIIHMCPDCWQEWQEEKRKSPYRY